MSNLVEEDTPRTQMARALLHLYTSSSAQCWQLIDWIEIYDHICSSHWGARWAFWPLFMAGIDRAARYRHLSKRNLETKDQWETARSLTRMKKWGLPNGMEYVIWFYPLLVWVKSQAQHINHCLSRQILKETGTHTKYLNYKILVLLELSIKSKYPPKKSQTKPQNIWGLKIQPDDSVSIFMKGFSVRSVI